MWVAKLPQVEVVVACDGKLNMVHCKKISELDGKEKSLILNFDSLQKHACRWRCKIAIRRLTMG